ncbi:hypothetical protein [Methylocucumis oryzae]|uniref:hypothetical protein n=1 Tax=Methylocucumis oryzae TaxID=1632867 RepID=UPI0006991AF8|nr:hypothetical protein [Methylocucumis oryzae]
MTQWYYKGNPYISRNNILINISTLKKNAKNTKELVGYLDTVLTGKQLPEETKLTIANYVRKIDLGRAENKGVRRSLEALYLVMSSPFYLIQR